MTKNEIIKPKIDLEIKINKLEKNYEELYYKLEEIKKIKENDIRNIVKEVIMDKNTKVELLKDLEQILVNKYNLIDNYKNNKKGKQIENNIIEKVKTEINNKEVKINQEITNIQKQLKDNFNDLQIIKFNNNNNYIVIQVKIDDNNLNKNILLFNQISTYKYFSNFERDDIETIINGQNVPIKYKLRFGDFKLNSLLKMDKKLQEIDYYLGANFHFY